MVSLTIPFCLLGEKCSQLTGRTSVCEEGADVNDFGPVSPNARVRWKRNTALYSTWEVQAMAFRLALKAASRDDAPK
jgi:hypothetical protein